MLQSTTSSNEESIQVKKHEHYSNFNNFFKKIMENSQNFHIAMEQADF